MSEINDIIEGCRKKNKKAQKALYNKYAPVLLGLCMRYVNDRSEAEDILQEGFLKIFLNINDFAAKGSFENWMKKIIVNTAITFYHKNFKHNQSLDIDDINENEVFTAENPEGEYTAKELLELINKMPRGYRIIFNLYAIEGYKHKEIAEMLKIDENTSKSQYARARKWIQNKLEAHPLKIEIENE